MRFLLALHVLVAGMYAVVGVLRALFSVFANSATAGSLWSFLTGAASAGVAAGLFQASRHGPGRNRGATHLVTACALLFLVLEALVLQFVLYRLTSVPPAAWLLALPTLAFFAVSASASWRLAAGRDHARPDSRERTGAPVSRRE